MSKEQTPIERFETELRHTYDNKLKNDHILKAFKVLSNQMVLEALESYKKEVIETIINTPMSSDAKSSLIGCI